jgi:hypothetical protein
MRSSTKSRVAGGALVVMFAGLEGCGAPVSDSRTNRTSPDGGEDVGLHDASPRLETGASQERDGASEAGSFSFYASSAVSENGDYEVTFVKPAWTFAGSLGVPANDIHRATGSDSIGPYEEVTFGFDDGAPKTGSIRVYATRPVALFTETYAKQTSNDGDPFPTFSSYPAVPYHLSYGDTEFAPVSFSALTADSPFVFFDANADTFIFSAVSYFMNAATAMLPDGAIASGIDPAVASLPAGFSKGTVLVAQTGIQAAYAAWGSTLTSLSGKARVASDGAPYLERVGYFTDNGAYYYYQYDRAIGYPATLANVASYFSGLGIPLGYMQIDSWWYPKGADELWTDKADGQYTYSADPTILPDGLSALEALLAVPLITHARWIDPSSPYRSEYTMSNNVSTDPRYWSDIASYLAASGAKVYEQDWLNQNALPDTTNLTDQDAFLDNMASAMATAGLDIQYCMPLPRHYLQASKYPNVTTTRVSVDRFSPPRYEDFLYVSLLTSSLGAWPWSDTFNSGETSNLLMSTLSAGMVGVGDQVGTASVANLNLAVRPDGVVVKPDVPIVPLDSTFLSEAAGSSAPLVAATYTDFGGGLRASYVYSFAASGDGGSARFVPSELGFAGQVLVYDFFGGSATLLDAKSAFTQSLGSNGGYDVVVPVGPSNIAFLGDLGKFVTLGKKRIVSESDDGTLTVHVVFAAGESGTSLYGYAPVAPSVSASPGSVGAVTWDATTKIFSVPVSPDSGAATIVLR